MQKKKRYLMLFVVILYFNLLIPGTIINFNNYDPKDEKGITTYLSTSNSAMADWNSTWGGSGNDYGYGVALDSSDNIYITGNTDSFGEVSNDMVLVKYSNSGVLQWNSTWGGSSNDIGYGVILDSSDNIYITGNTDSFGEGNNDMVLVKYNNSRMLQWNRTWGGISGDNGYSVAVDSSGNIYITGDTNSFGEGSNDMVLVKYDRDGDQLWNSTWGGIDYEAGKGVAVDTSGNIYITGYTNSFGTGNYDLALVKYDSDGIQQWNSTWGGGGSEAGNGVALDSSDNIYITGFTDSFGTGNDDLVLVKYDSDGIQQWNSTWGGIDNEAGSGVVVDSSDNIYITGYTNSFGEGGDDLVLVKYISSGVQQWNFTWGGIDNEAGSGVVVDSSDNIYITGFTDSFGGGFKDIVLVKYDNSGAQKYYSTWEGNNWNQGTGIAADSSDSIYIAGYTSNFALGGNDIVLVKYGEVQEAENGIPGYQLLLFFSIIGMIIVLISFKPRIKTI